MRRTHQSLVIPAACAAMLLSACQGTEAPVDSTETVDSGAAASKPLPVPMSPGKLSAPITLDYSIMGNPVVGQPVGINVQVSSPLDDRPILLQYRVDEVGSMTFPDSQAASAELLPLADAELRVQQVTVVPQREGRLYLVVSAEIETDAGAMMKSMSIPVQVGRAPAAPEAAGELVEGPDGEVGVSVPASEPR